jgi:hypothetical protein
LEEDVAKRIVVVDLDDPGVSFAEITPSDSVDLEQPARALYIGSTGNLRVIGVNDDNAVTFTSVPAGIFVPLVVRRVLSSGTTATNIVGIW